MDKETARIHSLRVERDAPLWEWWFIEGLDAVENVPPGSFALLFKLHHAAFDGVSAWEVINVSHDTEPNLYNGIADIADEVGNERQRPTQIDLIANAYKRAAMQPLKFMQLMWDSVPIAQKLLTNELKDFPVFSGKSPDTPFNHSVTPKRIHRKVPLTLDKIKRMRAIVPGATTNDVVLAVIGGALRQYLASRDLLPSISLNVGVPISIRADDAKGDAGNQALLAILPLGTDIESPLERLKSIHHWTTAKKNYVNTIPAHLLTEYMEFVPGNLVGLAVSAFTELKLANTLPSLFNVIVTNVPASRVPIYFAGSKMLEYDASGPIWDGAGLLHVVTSYIDMVNISFDCCAKMMPDPDTYVECLEKSIERLFSEVGGTQN